MLQGNNFGHKAQDCRLVKENAPIMHKEKPTMTWDKRVKENFNLALIVEDKKDEWYINNGCSTHMTRDKKKFVSLKEKGGCVVFGDN